MTMYNNNNNNNTGVDLPCWRPHGSLYRAQPVGRQRSDLQPHLLRWQQAASQQRTLHGERDGRELVA